MRITERIQVLAGRRPAAHVQWCSYNAGPKRTICSFLDSCNIKHTQEVDKTTQCTYIEIIIDEGEPAMHGIPLPSADLVLFSFFFFPFLLAKRRRSVVMGASKCRMPYINTESMWLAHREFAPGVDAIALHASHKLQVQTHRKQKPEPNPITIPSARSYLHFTAAAVIPLH